MYVKVSHSAQSLKGGMLEISPVLGPFPGDGVFGIASGKIRIEDPSVPRRPEQTGPAIPAGLAALAREVADKVGSAS